MAAIGLLLALGAAAFRPTVSVMCATIARQPPQVPTLLAAPNDTVKTAWIIQPDCKLDVVRLERDDDGAAMLNCSTRGIGQIESLPSAIERLYMDSNGVTEADFRPYSKLIHVILAWCELRNVDTFKFPPLLRELDFEGNRLEGIANGTIPDHVEYLYIGENNLNSLANFSLPSSLTNLYLQGNDFTSVNFALPDHLEGLFLNDTAPLRTIENLILPDSLTILSCPGCGVQTFRGVQLSSHLTTLDFSGAKLTDFEIRESDIAILKNVAFSGEVTQQKCQDASATLHVVGNVPACVINDAVFEAKYANRRRPGGTNSLPSDSSTSTASNSSALSTPAIVIIAVVAGLVCGAIAILIYRKCFRTKNVQTEDGKYHEITTLDVPESSGATVRSSMFAPNEYLSNDIRNDQAFMPFRIPWDEIQMHRVIAKGGFGVIYLATFRGRDVAVKQLLPQRARETHAVQNFMDEIRICASLEHPRIVEFIGLMWSKLQDLAVVIEFMAGGDLHTVLRTQTISNPCNWYQSSTDLKAKSLLALDISDALVYLHSFETPIIHRDLKARNVLLSNEGDAKLSDFGISREVVLDETMTGEIGTVAWIAPEVLRGERYAEKADIYSLGVLFVELDTARHPYRQEIVDAHGASQTNTRIALLVSTGKLVPSPSLECPPQVAALISSCLSFDPNERPSAMDLHYELRKMLEQETKPVM